MRGRAIVVGLSCAASWWIACASSGKDKQEQPPMPDAPVAAMCGDGICDVREIGACTADCGSPSMGATCGNGACETGETAVTCAMDCATAVCGDNMCIPPENQSNCPGDCGGSGSGSGSGSSGSGSGSGS